jgi:hypothetical protein
MAMVVKGLGHLLQVEGVGRRDNDRFHVIQQMFYGGIGPAMVFGGEHSRLGRATVVYSTDSW